jgi:hypothetical protein
MTATKHKDHKEKDHKEKKDRKVDAASDMSFPASDAPAHSKPTGTEPPNKPADRKAPKISRDDIERAQRGDGHKQGGH